MGQVEGLERTAGKTSRRDHARPATPPEIQEPEVNGSMGDSEEAK